MKKQAVFRSHTRRSTGLQQHRAVIKFDKIPSASFVVPVSSDDLRFVVSLGIGRLKKSRKFPTSVWKGIPNERSNSK